MRRMRWLVFLGWAIGASGCATNLASGPWPSSSDHAVQPLDHPTWESYNADLTADAEHRLVVFGDQRALADGEWQAMIEAIVLREAEYGERSPLLGVIDTGDIVFDGVYSDQFNLLGEILRPLNEWPYAVSVGNHEVHSNRQPQARRNVVDFLAPELGPQFTTERMYYRKDAPGHHLIFLDSNDLLYPADGSGQDAREFDERGRAQMEWLTQELAEMRDEVSEQLVTVVLHHPFLMSSQKHEDEGRRLWSLRYRGRTLPEILAEGGVDLVLCGHTHTYERFEVRDVAGRGFSLINVSGRPRGEILGFGRGGRRARDIRGREVEDLRRRGWQDLEGWYVDQRDAMVDVEADQWLEIRVVPGRTMVGELFYLGPQKRALSRGAFVIR